MKVFTPEISWHERDPIYTCAFHPNKKNRFATAGVTGVIRLWELESQKKDSTDVVEIPNKTIHNTSKLEVSFISGLKRHTKSVNVVRWNHDGTVLASAGDEAVVFLWSENQDKVKTKTLDDDDDESKETWNSFRTFRGHLEDILDISWSHDSSILITGSVDNSVIVWNVSTGAKISIVKEPKGFVQGVIYDPLGITYAALSTDRSMRIFSASNHKCLNNVSKIQMKEKEKENNEPSGTPSTTTTTPAPAAPNLRLFHDDTMKSFFRRMAFSPDGNLLFTPAGCLEVDDKLVHTSYIFTRNCYSKPCLYLPHDRPSVAISVCPFKFELNQKKVNSEEKVENLFNLPYRFVFAIATEDSVYFYDTQSKTPFAFVTGIHYSTLSDLSWSSDSLALIVTSIDGFCTFVRFNENELGQFYKEPEPIVPSPSDKLSMEQQETTTVPLVETKMLNTAEPMATC